MRRSALPRFVCGAFLSLAFFGCDGSSGGGNVDGGADAGGGRGGNSGGNAGNRPDGSAGGAGGLPVRPRPTINPEAKKLVPGEARLVGSPFSLTSCTHQEPTPGDRWCAFYQPSEFLGRTELWVVNVTKAASGTAVRCDGTDANCKRLTDDLWTSRPMAGPRHPTAHRFYGDTLIFHAGTSAGSNIYTGPVFAWRPEWAQPRQISTAKGLTCTGHPKAAVAFCLDNVNDNPDEVFAFDLLAGPLVDAPNSQLPKADRIVPLGENDETRWSADFSPDGGYFAWSTGKTGTDPEVLTIARTTELANPAAMRWKIEEPSRGGAIRPQFSADSQKIFFLRDYNYLDDEGNNSGTLVVADLPAGGNRLDVAAGVGDYIVLNNPDRTWRGVLAYRDYDQGLAAKLDWFPTVTAANPPATTIVSDTLAVVVSRDNKYVFAFRDVSQNGLTDAWVAEIDANPTPCALQRQPRSTLFGHPFHEPSNWGLWIENIDPATETGQGFSGSAADCTAKASFGRKIDLWFSSPTSNLFVATDEAVDEIATLKFTALQPGKGWPSAGLVSVQEQVNRNVGLVQPDLNIAVFTMWTRFPDVNGLYALPLNAAAPRPDGGTADAGPADAAADAL